MEDKLLIYEKSAPGRRGYTLPKLGRSEADVLDAIPEKFRRDDDARLPEVTEGEVMRHFVGISVKNHHIERGFYPLGSCTMKYNPKVNEKAAALPQFQLQHPLAPCQTASGSLELIWRLTEYLKEISGFAALSLQPVSGAHGEFAGLLIMQAYHREQGNNRHKIIIT